MCSLGCWCWKPVCGDCCFHTGCAVHDDYCRISMKHPYCVDHSVYDRRRLLTFIGQVVRGAAAHLASFPSGTIVPLSLT